MACTDSKEMDDDEWFTESFTRYNELVMLEMEWTVRRVRVFDPTTVTMLAEKTGDARQFLVQYTVPSKMFRTEQTVKRGDMTILSALSLENDLLVNIECLPRENATVASQKDRTGLKVFPQDLDDSGQFKRAPYVADVPLVEPEFCFVDDLLFLTAKQSSLPCHVVNIGSNAVQTLNIDDWSDKSLPESSLVPESLSKNSVALCRQLDGRAICYDLRAHKTTFNFSATNEPNSTWTFTSSHRANPNASSTLVCFKSSNGVFELYDLRAPQVPALKSQSRETSRDLTVKFSPDSSRVSTTTSTGSVVINRIKGSHFQQVFSHDGHLRMDNCSRDALITDHAWYDPNCVISSADNDSLNMWQFNEF